MLNRNTYAHPSSQALKSVKRSSDGEDPCWANYCGQQAAWDASNDRDVSGEMYCGDCCHVIIFFRISWAQNWLLCYLQVHWLGQVLSYCIFFPDDIGMWLLWVASAWNFSKIQYFQWISTTNMKTNQWSRQKKQQDIPFLPPQKKNMDLWGQNLPLHRPQLNMWSWMCRLYHVARSRQGEDFF